MFNEIFPGVGMYIPAEFRQGFGIARISSPQDQATAQVFKNVFVIWVHDSSLGFVFKTGMFLFDNLPC